MFPTSSSHCRCSPQARFLVASLLSSTPICVALTLRGLLSEVYYSCLSLISQKVGGFFPASQLKPEQVAAHQKKEEEDMNTKLDLYMHACNSNKIHAEKLIIEADGIVNGIMKMIDKHGVTKLVMGAAADKRYSKKMTMPKSKTACKILKEAPPSCKIWFVCKGQLIYVREATTGTSISRSSQSPSARSITGSLTGSELSSHRSLISLQEQEYIIQTKSDGDSFRTICINSLHEIDTCEPCTPQSPLSIKEVIADFPGVPRNPISTGSFLTESCKNLYMDTTAKHQIYNDNHDLFTSYFVHEIEDDQLSSSGNDYLYKQLQEALKKVAKFKGEAHEESQKCANAEKELWESNRRVKTLEMRCAEDMKLLKEIEELVDAEKLELGNLRKEIKSMIRYKVERKKLSEDNIYKELEKVCGQKLALEIQIEELEHAIRDKEVKLKEECELQVTLRKERDSAIRELEELRLRKYDGRNTYIPFSFLEFTRAELEKATNNFDDSLKIGEGCRGSVFKGSICHATVAIKILNPKSLKGQSDFIREVSIIGSVRHPNIITLVGASYESSALIYEFVPNGSLEDRLACKDGTPPLPWQIRIRILIEICSALIFLHSSTSKRFVHGDLQPANILLDANYVSKLTDFGIGHLIQSNNAILHWTNPKGSFVYLDPEFFSTGELTSSSDVYSFGVTILCLLTGRPPLGIVREIQDACDNGMLRNLLDPAAGEWPLVQAEQLARLGIRCCEMMRKSRPDLENDVFFALESMKSFTL